MMDYAGQNEAACQKLTVAAEMIPPDSRFHEVAVASLQTALTASDDVPTVRSAVRRLKKIPDRWKGLKRLSLARGKLSWAIGGGLARLAWLDTTLSEQREDVLREAAGYLREAVRSLETARAPLETAACRADWSVVMIQLKEPASVALYGPDDGLSTEVATALQDALALSQDRRPQGRLWRALRTLRAATEREGMAPPVFGYFASSCLSP
jgi:hypothetical protein